MKRLVFLTCPMMLTVAAALDWFEAHGCVDPVLWRADDGTIRGRGEVRQ